MRKWLVIGIALLGLYLLLSKRKIPQTRGSGTVEETDVKEEDVSPPKSITDRFRGQNLVPQGKSSESQSEFPRKTYAAEKSENLSPSAAPPVKEANVHLSSVDDPKTYLSKLTGEYAYELGQAFVNKSDWNFQDEIERLYLGRFEGFAESERDRIPIKIEFSKGFSSTENCIIVSMPREGTVAGFLSDNSLDVWRTTLDEHFLIFQFRNQSRLYLYTIVDSSSVAKQPIRLEGKLLREGGSKSLEIIGDVRLTRIPAQGSSECAQYRKTPDRE